MITVAIVGILASIALPSYRNYVVRAEIMSAFHELEKYKFHVKKYIQDNGDFSALVSEYTTGWKRTKDVAEMFEMSGSAMNVSSDYLANGDGRIIDGNKQYYRKRGDLRSKNHFRMHIYLNETFLGPDAPYVISYWAEKNSNGKIIYTCHSYNTHHGGWDKKGMQYLPPECRH